VLNLTGPGGTQKLSGTGPAVLSIGSYRAVISGDHYLPLEDRLEITRGDTLSFAPSPAYTAEYTAILAEIKRKETEDTFRKSLADRKSRMAVHTGEDDELAKELEDIRTLRETIETSEYAFPDLLEQARELNLKALENRLEELEALTSAADKQTRRRSIGRWTAFGFGAGGFALTGIYQSLGAAEYQNYLAAPTTDESEELHILLQNYSVAQIAGAVIGTVATLTGLFLSTPRGDGDIYVDEIAALSAERAILEGGM